MRVEPAQPKFFLRKFVFSRLISSASVFSKIWLSRLKSQFLEKNSSQPAQLAFYYKSRVEPAQPNLVWSCSTRFFFRRSDCAQKSGFVFCGHYLVEPAQFVFFTFGFSRENQCCQSSTQGSAELKKNVKKSGFWGNVRSNSDSGWLQEARSGCGACRAPRGV